MTGRIIVFGATGFTGRLTAEALTRAGAAPVLAGRSPERLVDLVGELAGLAPMDSPPTWQQADAADPDSVRALVTSPADVLLTTVGPFAKFGGPALAAAIDQGCGYVDSTGEPGFIREIFEKAGPRAVATGARLLTACGYDYLPGNLAAALALRDCQQAGRSAMRVEVGYFVRGGMAMSSGTRASVAGMVGQRPFAFQDGRVREYSGSVATFDMAGRQWQALPVGGSEHFTVPRMASSVREVGVYLGWAGKWTRVAHSSASVMGAVTRIPGVGKGMRALMHRTSPTATGEGPDAATRAKATSIAIARTLDGVGRELSSATVRGPSPYDMTAELLAWTAAMLATGQTTEVGALGPVDAFGLEAVERGCADLGLLRVA